MASDKVIDLGGTYWNASESREGVVVLTRGWGVTTQKRFAVFGRERTAPGFDRYGLREATEAECERYLATI